MLRRIWEILKSILIPVLVLNLLLLTLMALPVNITRALPLPGFLAEFIGVGPTATFQPVSQDALTETTIPMTVSVRQGLGRATIRRDTTTLSLVYDRFSGLFATALSSATDPVALSVSADYLKQWGVLFSYAGQIPAQALSQWLSETDGQVDGVYSQYFLALADSQVFLYVSGRNGVTRYSTQVSQRELLARLEEYAPDGTHLAAEVSDAVCSPFTLWESSAILSNYTAVNPLTPELKETLAELLDFNPYGAGSYTDPATGNITYTENDRSLTISKDGQVILSAQEGSYARFAPDGETPADYIAAARRLLMSFYAGISSDTGSWYLYDFQEENGVITCTFCAVLDSVPIFPAGVKVSFRNGALTGFTATVRSFHKTGEISRLMPMEQAAAIAAPGAFIFPAYQLSAGGLNVGWQQN